MTVVSREQVKEPVHLAAIHDASSFHKYMAKCVQLLIGYLAKNPNWHLSFVLTMQWSKLLRARGSANLKLHQKQQLFSVILTDFIRSASNHLAQYNRATAKTKHFLDFYMNLYELYIECKKTIKTEHRATYSRLMIDCYRLCRAEQDDSTADTASAMAAAAVAGPSTGKHRVDRSTSEFKQSLNFCETESSNRRKAKKPSTTKANKPDNNSSSANNNPKKQGSSGAKSNQLAWSIRIVIDFDGMEGAPEERGTEKREIRTPSNMAHDSTAVANSNWTTFQYLWIFGDEKKLVVCRYVDAYNFGCMEIVENVNGFLFFLEKMGCEKCIVFPSFAHSPPRPSASNWLCYFR